MSPAQYDELMAYAAAIGHIQTAYERVTTLTDLQDAIAAELRDLRTTIDHLHHQPAAGDIQ